MGCRGYPYVRHVTNAWTHSFEFDFCVYLCAQITHERDGFHVGLAASDGLGVTFGYNISSLRAHERSSRAALGICASRMVGACWSVGARSDGSMYHSVQVNLGFGVRFHVDAAPSWRMW